MREGNISTRYTNNSDQINSKEYQDTCKILAAAVINKQFRDQLLSNPLSALENGFGGQRFQIGSEMKARISTIRAKNLADFTMQFTQQFNTNASAIPCLAAD